MATTKMSIRTDKEFRDKLDRLRQNENGFPPPNKSEMLRILVDRAYHQQDLGTKPSPSKSKKKSVVGAD